jgi:predicted DNA-binding transcriptional regulator YafY
MGEQMRDEVAIKRQWLIIRTLCARRHGASVRELAREHGVSDKTIRRDLDLFRSVGFPLVESAGARGRKTWRITEGDGPPGIQFTFDEAIVIYLARPFLEPLAGTHLWDAAQSAFRKIRATLRENSIAYLERFPQMFHYTTAGFADYRSKAGIIDDLSVAIEDQKAIRIAYQSQHAREAANRRVYPYGLARHKGALYLVAFAPDHDQVRHYKVNRIESLAVESHRFERPADFDVARHFARSFGVYEGDDDVTVVVRFLPAAARYVQESHWHPSQSLTEQPDGSVLARFQLSSTVEIKSWVLSFGASAVVIEPAALRDEIARELAELSKLYESRPM